jgi:hypothetical protein
LPIAILVPIRIRAENPQFFASWESPYDSAKRENALAIQLRHITGTTEGAAPVFEALVQMQQPVQPLCLQQHGSWLNLAESELAVLAGQCLDRRIADLAMLSREVAAWLAQRNAADTKASWRFTTEDARIKLKTLYPSL